MENYPIYILCGQVLYNFFSESTQSAMNSIINSAALIKKVYVPKYIFVLSRVLSCSINIFAAYAALLIVMVVLRTPLHYTMFLSVIPIAIMIIFSMGVGFILFLTGFIYLAPIMYPIDILGNVLYRIVKLNPVTNILEMFRGFMMYNSMPDVYTVVMAIGPSIIVFIFGLWVFYKKQDEFILYL